MTLIQKTTLPRTVIAALAIVILSGGAARADADRAGNGGGAWVCRAPGGAIRSAQLVDLFEAESEFKLTLAAYSGPYAQIVAKARARLAKAMPDLHDALSPYFAEIGDLVSHPPKIVHTTDVLTIIDDSLYRLRPAPSRCPGGQIAYEQAVNFKPDGYILVQSGLFDGTPPAAAPLSETDKAALVVHEALYAHRRASAGDKNSVLTRRIVGLLFSNLTIDELRSSITGLADEGTVIGMKFVRIPAGRFLMGTPPSRDFTLPVPPNEIQHEMVIARSFEIAQTEVTQRQYVRVMKTAARPHPNPSAYAWSKDFCPDTYDYAEGMCPDNPVDHVSFEQAQAFVARLTSQRNDGWVYRLPTEAEWEYAARAGTTSPNYFDVARASRYAWLSEPQARQPRDPQAIATRLPNAWGLYDMIGNVAEWVSDWYVEDYRRLPNGGPATPPEIRRHVYRGCSAKNTLDSCYSAARFPTEELQEYPPYPVVKDVVGLRLARTRR